MRLDRADPGCVATLRTPRQRRATGRSQGICPGSAAPRTGAELKSQVQGNHGLWRSPAPRAKTGARAQICPWDRAPAPATLATEMVSMDDTGPTTSPLPGWTDTLLWPARGCLLQSHTNTASPGGLPDLPRRSPHGKGHPCPPRFQSEAGLRARSQATCLGDCWTRGQRSSRAGRAESRPWPASRPSEQAPAGAGRHCHPRAESHQVTPNSVQVNVCPPNPDGHT